MITLNKSAEQSLKNQIYEDRVSEKDLLVHKSIVPTK